MDIAIKGEDGTCWNRLAFETHAKLNNSDTYITCSGCALTALGRQCTARMTGDTNPTSESTQGMPIDTPDLNVPGVRIIEPGEHRRQREATVMLPAGWLEHMA